MRSILRYILLILHLFKRETDYLSFFIFSLIASEIMGNVLGTAEIDPGAAALKSPITFIGAGKRSQPRIIIFSFAILSHNSQH